MFRARLLLLQHKSDAFQPSSIRGFFLHAKNFPKIFLWLGFNEFFHKWTCSRPSIILAGAGWADDERETFPIQECSFSAATRVFMELPSSSLARFGKEGKNLIVFQGGNFSIIFFLLLFYHLRHQVRRSWCRRATSSRAWTGTRAAPSSARQIMASDRLPAVKLCCTFCVSRQMDTNLKFSILIVRIFWFCRFWLWFSHLTSFP